MDEPAKSMVVSGALVLRDPIPFEHFRDLVASRLAVLPGFDLSHHARVAPLERPDQPSLQNLVGRPMSAALDSRWPLWQFHFVPQYEDGCAVIWRFHHCLGDGVALLYLLLQLTDTPLVAPMHAPSEPQQEGHTTASGALLTRTRLALISLVSCTRSTRRALSRSARAQSGAANTHCDAEDDRPSDRLHD
jgi:hypothetical protein